MTEATDEGAGGFPACSCKVGRVLEARGMDGMNERMAEAWATGDASLRDLERTFNVAVLRDAGRTAGISTLDGEVKNLYRLLRDDDVTAGSRTQARNRLEREGVDVAAVESDFVSHQTIHNHLRDCLDVDRDSDDRDPVATAEDRIRSLQTRMEVVTEDAIERLRNAGAVSEGEVDVYVDVSLVCNECGERHELGAFLAGGGCDCATRRE